jgi:hypothetical protein
MALIFEYYFWKLFMLSDKSVAQLRCLIMLSYVKYCHERERSETYNLGLLDWTLDILYTCTSYNA